MAHASSALAKDSRANPPLTTTPSLLRLPVELHCLILEDLSLSASILYQSQICSSLRSQFERRWRLPHPHRFSLVDWLAAEREVGNILRRQGNKKLGAAAAAEVSEIPSDNKDKRSIWDTNPMSTPRPAPAKSSPRNAAHPTFLGLVESPGLRARHHSEAEGEDVVLAHSNHPDVAFLIRCMRLLHKMEDSKPIEEQRFRNRCDQWTSLILLSRSGFRVEPLIQLLETQPSLQYIETILMTSASSVDAVLWNVFAPPRAKRWRKKGQQARNTDMQFNSSNCIETQAIVIPGHNSQKGQGLRSGFKALCLSNNDTLHANSCEEDISDDEDTTPFTFHVIYHDWYDEDEAKGTQNMLENSDITCNTCKNKIRFQ
ncbi:hypothetical protein CBS101457_004435 [Exobasidium rhododendri]|nr:hypothetical protein CBS101457_004435 [Exobasidium rhododendri]